jgi:uncharacterized protein (DUF58 family)
VTRTRRWAGLAAATLLILGVGVVFRSPGPVLAAAVGAGVLAVRAAAAPPSPELSVDRRLSTTTPEPEADVTVEVTVGNEGDALYDLRLLDGVPDGLAVVDGPARHATSLRPGDAATFAYTVQASRGRHVWGPATAIARDPIGAHEREVTVAVPTELRCVPAFEGTAELPLRGLTTPYAGRVSTAVGGDGIEFHAVREYRRGDPRGRVDWNRAARTGELATLELREERAATVVLVVDARRDAYVAPEPEVESAVERSVHAAGALGAELLSTGDRVGASAFSPRGCWVPPDTGTGHRARLRDSLGTDPAFAPTPPTDTDPFIPRLWRTRFRRRLPTDAQVILFSPCVDDPPIRLAERLHAVGHLVTLVAPDPTPPDGVGGRIAGIERGLGLSGLRGSGVRVLEWSYAEPFAVAADRAARRWPR